MGDDAKNATPSSDGAESTSSGTKKGLPVKTILIVLVMLALEGAAIVGVMSMFGRPSPVHAEAPVLEEEAVDEGDQLYELSLLREKMTNSSSGRVYIYDSEILIVVKAKFQADVEHMMEQRMGAIRTGISSIWAKAEHSYFSEPGRETLTRQTLDYLRATFGKDASGEDRIDHVLIPRCLGMPADF